MNTNFECTFFWIQGDVPHQIWEATTADGSQANPLLTRFLHNKVLFYAENIVRCYHSYLSPNFISQSFWVVGLILFYTGVYVAVAKKKWWLILLLVLGPLAPLFQFPESKLYQGYFLYVPEFLMIIYGLIFIIQRWVRQKKLSS